MPDTLVSLKQLIHDKFDIDGATLDVNKPLSEYGLDSLAQVELMFTVEDHFNVNLPSSASNIDTLTGLSVLIDQLRLMPA